MSAPVIDSQTDTELVFTVDLPATAGALDIVLIGPAGEEGARAADAIEVYLAADLTSISPTTAEATRATTYTVVGEHLLGITAVQLVEQGVAAINVTPQGLTDTGFTFAFTATSGAQEGVYDLVAQGAHGEDLLLDNAITITPYVDTTPRIDSVSPTSVGLNVSTTFTVTGYGIDQGSEFRVGVSGVGFDDFTPQNETLTSATFTGPLTRTGVQNLILNKTGGTGYLRLDGSITVT